MHSVALLPPDDCHCMQKSESSYWEPFWLPHSSQPSRHSSKSKIRNRKSRDPPTSTLMSGMTVIAPRCSKAPHGGGHDQGPATRREDPDEGESLRLTSPFPHLQATWTPAVPGGLDSPPGTETPDAGELIDLMDPFHPQRGPMVCTAARLVVRGLHATG
jgi:hypothetical protein